MSLRRMFLLGALGISVLGCGDDTGGGGGQGGAAVGGSGQGGTGEGGAAALPQGASCSTALACASGSCVDGVCCESACTGECQACSLATNGVADGTCAPALAGENPHGDCQSDVGSCFTGSCDGNGACEVAIDGEVCRAASGDCDLPELCVAGSCPADGFRTAGEECRASGGSCDPTEFCTGTDAACPVDALTPAGTSCRASQGDCDLEETCDGIAAECPADTLAPATAVCRASAGDCDAEELCTGAEVACPADGKLAPQTSCRALQGVCDVAESCDGVSDDCPADQVLASGVASSCAPYVCGGTSVDCPSSCTTSAQCGSGFACSNQMCLAAKRVFITASAHTGNLGGVSGANAICQNLAAQAGLPGSYKAWISTAATSPSANFTQHPGPYMQVNGDIIADSWADLTDGSLDMGINRTQSNVFVPTQSARVWTGTNTSGQRYQFNGNDYTCGSFTNGTNGANGQTGLVGFSSAAWTVSGDDSCNNSFRLYCFEQ